MSRVFPTQVTAYLNRLFPYGNIPDDVVQLENVIGIIAGFIDLYDRLPQDLIRLSEDDYADLVAAVGTIRLCITQYQHTGVAGRYLAPIGNALKTAKARIGLLTDEARTEERDLLFIADEIFRKMICIDLGAIETSIQSGEWKGATIIAGSCSETALLYALQVIEGRGGNAVADAVASVTWKRGAPPAADLTDQRWNLFSYTNVTHKLGLISDNTKDELLPARDYRNLIHPAKSIRERVSFDRGTALIGYGALLHVLSDLKKNL